MTLLGPFMLSAFLPMRHVRMSSTGNYVSQPNHRPSMYEEAAKALEEPNQCPSAAISAPKPVQDHKHAAPHAPRGGGLARPARPGRDTRWPHAL